MPRRSWQNLLVRVQKSSHSDTPKMKLVLKGTTSPALMLYVSCIQEVRINNGPCSTITPLGLPVVPGAKFSHCVRPLIVHYGRWPLLTMVTGLLTMTHQTCT